MMGAIFLRTNGGTMKPALLCPVRQRILHRPIRAAAGVRHWYHHAEHGFAAIKKPNVTARSAIVSSGDNREAVRWPRGQSSGVDGAVPVRHSARNTRRRSTAAASRCCDARASALPNDGSATSGTLTWGCRARVPPQNYRAIARREFGLRDRLGRSLH